MNTIKSEQSVDAEHTIVKIIETFQLVRYEVHVQTLTAFHDGQNIQVYVIDQGNDKLRWFH